MNADPGPSRTAGSCASARFVRETDRPPVHRRDRASADRGDFPNGGWLPTWPSGWWRWRSRQSRQAPRRLRRGAARRAARCGEVGLCSRKNGPRTQAPVREPARTLVINKTEPAPPCKMQLPAATPHLPQRQGLRGCRAKMTTRVTKVIGAWHFAFFPTETGLRPVHFSRASNQPIVRTIMSSTLAGFRIWCPSSG